PLARSPGTTHLEPGSQLQHDAQRAVRLRAHAHGRDDATGGGRLEVSGDMRVGQIDDDPRGIVEGEEFVRGVPAEIQGELRRVRPGGEPHESQFRSRSGLRCPQGAKAHKTDQDRCAKNLSNHRVRDATFRVIYDFTPWASTSVSHDSPSAEPALSSMSCPSAPTENARVISARGSRAAPRSGHSMSHTCFACAHSRNPRPSISAALLRRYRSRCTTVSAPAG